jgi:murein DD-endopeptidase MepM/ murein hydrolase activator NlpD
MNGYWIQSVQPSLIDTAKKYAVSIADLEELNGLDQRDPLQMGQVIFIPGRPKGAKGKPTGSPKSERKSKTAVMSPGQKAVAAGFIWPVRGGRLSSPFGMRRGRPHEGIDIAAPAGTSIFAVADGEVVYSGSGVRGYGNLIIVRHKSKLVSVYAHNRRNLVKRGKRVKQGSVIGEVGKTGRATGNHLHFEIRKGEDPVDPIRHLPPKP